MATFVVSRRVLLIAFHFPPVRGSSGVQRTLKFARYLADYGWEPAVLTVNPRAYPAVGDELLAEIPASVPVKRAFALDASRHLAVGGRYPQILAWPDRWSSWLLGAVPAGLRLIRRWRPKVLWSTYPIATAHLAGLALHRMTGLPWVADFRDSMTEPDYPRDAHVRNIYRWIERRAVARADRVIFTAPGTQRMYEERYPELPPSHWACIPNGFDEDNFRELRDIEMPCGNSCSRLVLLHSGVLYPSERDPTAFFDAVARLKRTGRISARDLSIRLRATKFDDLYGQMLADRDIRDIIELAPQTSYREALGEMLGVDGLLIFQASNCNHQIPAKAYEYMRAGRPVLALTDPTGDTALLMREAGIDTIAPLDDTLEIERALENFLRLLRLDAAPVANEQVASHYSRRAQTANLAALLDQLVNEQRLHQ